jgi:2,3-bisphosphoglycerate-independent phosphoglycerate mutase
MSSNIKSLTGLFKGRRPLINIVLDGWGVGAHDEGDALWQADTPVLDHLLAHAAASTILTHGHHVGLPAAKDIGGSEVGHMTMGAGRVIAQGPTRIQRAIESGAFFKGEVLGRLLENCRAGGHALHLLGLLSDGNVHSNISHFYAVIEEAERRGVSRVFVHALLDGRDVPFQSALDYVEPLEARLAQIEARHEGWCYSIASGGGREMITMDRDEDWDKVARGWAVHVRGEADARFERAGDAVRELRQAQPDAVDQDLPPFVIMRGGRPVGPIRDGDSVIFMNFRGDRAIEFSRAMVEHDFAGFDRGDRPRVLFAGMMRYDEDTDLPPEILMPPTSVSDGFGRRILEAGLTQFRLAETQKYAHVTFFFNGGYREPLDRQKETYHLIPSDRVPSFAQAPAMKAREIGAKAAEFIRSGKYDFGLINFANADMVGHTGNLAAAILAAEAVDHALGVILQALKEAGGLLLITADHGNADEMVSLNPKTHAREINTRHSINPVPVVLYDPAWQGPEQYQLRPSTEDIPNKLSMLAATNYILLGRKPPDDVDRPLFDLS